jgi:hypothetical protein
MSEKRYKSYRRVRKNLERNALEHYENLTFFQKLKWGFNKKKYIKWYCENNKRYYDL